MRQRERFNPHGTDRSGQYKIMGLLHSGESVTVCENCTESDLCRECRIEVIGEFYRERIDSELDEILSDLEEY